MATKGITTTNQWDPKQGATMCVRHLAHSASADVRVRLVDARQMFVSG